MFLSKALRKTAPNWANQLNRLMNLFNKYRRGSRFVSNLAICTDYVRSNIWGQLHMENLKQILFKCLKVICCAVSPEIKVLQFKNSPY